jgi:hypothetical protein
MADESQVEAAIVTLLGSVLYPLGTTFPSVVNNPINVERGWPTEADVRVAVQTNLSIIRVHAVTGFSKDETRFPRAWLDQATGIIPLTASLSGYKLIFGGTCIPGLYIGVISQGVGYTYVTTVLDTPSTIAAALGAAIPGSTSSGLTVMLFQGGLLPEVILTQVGNSMLEPGRVAQLFTVAVWAPTPALRDAILQIIFAQLSYTYRLVLADGSIATLMDIQGTGPEDIPGRAGEWRRDIRLHYDYAITLVQNFPPVTVAVLNMNAENYQNV